MIMAGKFKWVICEMDSAEIPRVLHVCEFCCIADFIYCESNENSHGYSRNGGIFLIDFIIGMKG